MIDPSESSDLERNGKHAEAERVRRGAQKSSLVGQYRIVNDLALELAGWQPNQSRAPTKDIIMSGVRYHDAMHRLLVARQDEVIYNLKSERQRVQDARHGVSRPPEVETLHFPTEPLRVLPRKVCHTVLLSKNRIRKQPTKGDPTRMFSYRACTSQRKFKLQLSDARPQASTTPDMAGRSGGGLERRAMAKQLWSVHCARRPVGSHFDKVPAALLLLKVEVALWEMTSESFRGRVDSNCSYFGLSLRLAFFLLCNQYLKFPISRLDHYLAVSTFPAPLDIRITHISVTSIAALAQRITMSSFCYWR